MNSSCETDPKSIFGGPSNATKEEIEGETFEHQGDHSAMGTPTALANENVAPFLAKHIPEQYGLISSRAGESTESGQTNSKYCYRHRPDLKCRRQADEPSMDKLQRVWFFFCYVWLVWLSAYMQEDEADSFFSILGPRNAPSRRSAGNHSCVVTLLSRTRQAPEIDVAGYHVPVLFPTIVLRFGYRP